MIRLVSSANAGDASEVCANASDDEYADSNINEIGDKENKKTTKKKGATKGSSHNSRDPPSSNPQRSG